MKVLLIHNSHRSGSSSGDDMVFKKEAGMLEQAGHTVMRYNPSNDSYDKNGPFGKVLTIAQIPWSFKSYREVRDILARERPDIVHIHNFFPLLSPSIYYAIRNAGVPSVQTLHDFRFLCPMAYLMRDGEVCDRCKYGAFTDSIRFGCFKGSRTQSIPVAFMHKLHHLMKTYHKMIDSYIYLTKNQRGIYEFAGFDKERLYEKPNFIEDSFKGASPHMGDYALFIGRLSDEKGLRILIKAWKSLPEIPLKIIGSGPQGVEYKSLVNSLGITNIDFLGYKPHEECMESLDSARFLVMPSIWYETFGLTIVEAFSHFKPVVASNLGAMADIVAENLTGVLFRHNDAGDLAGKIRKLWNSPAECAKMGENARKEYEAKYTPDRNIDMLVHIYKETIRRKRLQN